MKSKNILLSLIILGVMLSSFFIYKKLTKTRVTKGKVILLDGTSSSGKSSISKILQKDLKCEYIFLDNYLYNQIADWLEKQVLLKENKKISLPRNNTDAILSYYDSMPNKDNYIISGDTFDFKKSKELMIKDIKNFVSHGETVICDIVFTPGFLEAKDFISFLENIKIFNILVYCPFKTLVERVEKRNNEAKEGKVSENRLLIMALEQFGMKYKKQENAGEISIGKLTRQDFNWAIEITKDELKIEMSKVLAKEAREMKKYYEKFVKDLTKQLGFDDKTIDFIEVRPREHYDLIVNTGEKSSQECAEKIKTLIA